mmetsp:Transcript_35640/g.80046  ORF Transcript_35640/g.80046 Transcript_35640/m.80046 type:complete len:286 (+) Transcript_35640:157-1014(+)
MIVVARTPAAVRRRLPAASSGGRGRTHSSAAAVDDAPAGLDGRPQERLDVPSHGQAEASRRDAPGAHLDEVPEHPPPPRLVGPGLPDELALVDVVRAEAEVLRLESLPLELGLVDALPERRESLLLLRVDPAGHRAGPDDRAAGAPPAAPAGGEGAVPPGPHGVLVPEREELLVVPRPGVAVGVHVSEVPLDLVPRQGDDGRRRAGREGTRREAPGEEDGVEGAPSPSPGATGRGSPALLAGIAGGRAGARGVGALGPSALGSHVDVGALWLWCGRFPLAVSILS